MAIAHQSFGYPAVDDPPVTVNTYSFSPSGTPRGILVLFHINNNGASATSVTYGGVAMTKVDDAVDTTTEPIRIEGWFLGASIPTGTQNVVITLNTAEYLSPAIISMSAAADTEVVDFGILENNQANPQIALDSGATDAIRYTMIGSGLAAVTNLTPVSGMTAVGSRDHGSIVERIDRRTSVESGSQTIGYTAATDDVAMVAVAIAEVGGSPQTLTGVLFSAVAGFATGLASADYSLSGSLFSVVSSFNTGTISATRTLAGSLFSVPGSFPVGSVLPGGVGLAGNIFQVIGSFAEGAIAAEYGLAGNLFSVLGQFPVGSVEATNMVSGNLFQVLGQFPIGAIAPGGMDILGSPFSVVGQFPSGLVIPDVVMLDGSLFSVVGQFPTGTFGNVMAGNIFQVLGTFPIGQISPGEIELAGNLFSVLGSFPEGFLGSGLVLSGDLFSALSQFPAGVLSPSNVVTGNLFQVVGSFPVGVLANDQLFLLGELYTVLATFPSGNIALLSVLGSLGGLRWPETDFRTKEDIARSRRDLTRTWQQDVRSPN